MRDKILRRVKRIDQMKIPDKENPKLLPDLQANYLYGFEEEDFENCNPIVKNAFMLKHATPNQMLRFKKEKAMKKYQNHPLDTSSLKV